MLGLRRSLLAQRVAATHTNEPLGEVIVAPAQRAEFAKPQTCNAATVKTPPSWSSLRRGSPRLPVRA
jgi:hypothetical protein